MVYELIIIGFGFIFRISQYLFNRSLWLDESSISLEIISKSFLDLFKPLNYELSAPIGFLIFEKLSVTLFGISEMALRIFPLIVNLFSLYLFYSLAKKILERKALVIGLFLFSFSDIVIYYASEVKAYSLDVFVGLLLTSLYINLINKSKLKPKNFMILTISGLLSIFFSQPAVFTLAGIGIGLFLCFRRQLGDFFRLSIVYLFLSFGFIANYYFFLLPTIRHSGLQGFWSASFLRIDLDWFRNFFLNNFYHLLGIRETLIVFALYLFGSYLLAKKKPLIFLGLFLPFVFTLVASYIRVYPFSGRLLLFLLPGIIVIVSYSLSKILVTKYLYLKIIGLGLIFYFGLALSLNAFRSLIYPRTVEEIRPLVKYYQDQKEEDDILYLYYGSRLQFGYYSQLLNLKNINVISGRDRSFNINNYLHDVYRLEGKSRVWFLFSHTVNINDKNEERFIIEYLDRKGRRLDYVSSQGAAIYLYDLR